MSLVKFLASGAGRLLRVVAGIVLILAGLLLMDGVPGYVVAVIGIVPLVAGVIDVCVFAPLFGAPLQGEAIRKS